MSIFRGKQKPEQLLAKLLERKRMLERQILLAVQSFEIETGAAVITVVIPKLPEAHKEMGFTQKLSVKIEV